MLKVGLTGGIASGKSTVCDLFSQYNIPIIDADIISRQLVAPGQKAFTEIIQIFGHHLLQKDGTLNRQKLRQIIFSDDIAKQQLETLLHPKIRQQLQLQSDSLSADYCILAIPLLIESNMQNLVDRVLIIDIEPTLQLERLYQRDDMSIRDAQIMINKQCDPSQRLAIANDIINNNNAYEELKHQVQQLHQKYSALIK